LRDVLPTPAGSQAVTKGKTDRRRARHERCGPSKVETLRLAVAYISCLARLVYSFDEYSQPMSPPDDQQSDTLNSVVVVQSQLHPAGRSGKCCVLCTFLFCWQWPLLRASLRIDFEYWRILPNTCRIMLNIFCVIVIISLQSMQNAQNPISCMILLARYICTVFSFTGFLKYIVLILAVQ